MIEILILWQLCKTMGNIVREKGRSVGGYRLLLIVMWFGGEIGGGLCASIAGMERGGVYLCAMAGAIVGTVGAFVIAKSLSPVTAQAYTGGFPVMHQPSADQVIPKNEL